MKPSTAIIAGCFVVVAIGCRMALFGGPGRSPVAQLPGSPDAGVQDYTAEAVAGVCGLLGAVAFKVVRNWRRKRNGQA